MAICIMKDPAPKRQRDAPVPVRFSRDQLAQLDRLRGKLSRSAYIKWRTLEGDAPAPAVTSRTSSKLIIRDYALISKALGLLGQSGIADSIHDLSDALTHGGNDVPPEVQVAGLQGLKDVNDILNALLGALPGKEKL